MSGDDKISSLRNAADEAARTARQSYVTFMLLTIYVLIIASSTAHEQLLRNSSEVVPFLNISLPVSVVFLLGPLLYTLFHSNVLIQFMIFSRKLEAFSVYVNEQVNEQDRRFATSLLYPFIFSEIFVSNGYSRPIRWLITASLVVSIFVLPPLALCLIQIRFLPFHHWWIADGVGLTELHQLLVLIDLVLILYLGPKIIPYRSRPFSDWRSLAWQVPTVVAAIAVLSLSFVLAARPHSHIGETVSHRTPERFAHQLDRWIPKDLHLPERPLLEKSPNMETVKWDEKSDPFQLELLKATVGLDLRGRDLRGANFQGANLSKAQLSGADLRGANLRNAKLSGAILYDAEANSGAMLDGADLSSAELLGADLRHAKFVGARLTSAQLLRSNISDADFTGANLQRANIVMAWALRTTFESTDLAYANLRYFQPINVKFNNVVLQGATLDDPDEYDKVFGAEAEEKRRDKRFSEAEKAQLKAEKDASELSYKSWLRIRLPAVPFGGSEEDAFDNRNTELCSRVRVAPTILVSSHPPCGWQAAGPAEVNKMAISLARDVICKNRFAGQGIVGEMTEDNLIRGGKIQRLPPWSLSRFRRDPQAEVLWLGIAGEVLDNERPCETLAHIPKPLIQKLRATYDSNRAATTTTKQVQ